MNDLDPNKKPPICPFLLAAEKSKSDIMSIGNKLDNAGCLKEKCGLFVVAQAKLPNGETVSHGGCTFSMFSSVMSNLTALIGEYIMLMREGGDEYLEEGN